jgi:phosphohistidine phosphatase
MRVVLFRHGPAGRRDASRWPNDGLRPLTSRGEERTREAAQALRRLLGEESLVVWTSPLTRCVQTAEIVAEALPESEVVKVAALAPGGSSHEILRHLAEQDGGDTLVLVGHEPDLGKLAGTLVFGAPAALPMKKAGACLIQFVGDPAAGEGELRWFLPPRVLRKLARRKAKV